MLHQKHTNLTRKQNENYAPNEVAILGSNCTVISDLVRQVSSRISNYKLAYLDASHAKNIEKNELTEYIYHHDGNVQIKTTSKVNSHAQRIEFSMYDFVFINGNHYQGAKQILILDEAKEASVLKRVGQLNNIQFIVKLKSETTCFSFLEETYPQIKNIPSYTIDEIEKITNHIKNLIKENIARVKGLVLIGGKSTRMGIDKSTLNYFGKPQKEHIFNLLKNKLDDVFYSVAQSSENANEIHDTFLNLGPFGGICSAFQKDPNSAWLVIANDVPFVNEKLIQLLLNNRNSSKIATAIKGKDKKFPEPLITIYEPRAYEKLLQYLAQGYSCPRKMLINSDVETIEVDDNFITNVNTPKEFEEAKKILQKLKP